MVATSIFAATNENVKGKVLSKVSKKISEYSGYFLKELLGEGTTEFDMQFNI